MKIGIECACSCALAEWSLDLDYATSEKFNMNGDYFSVPDITGYKERNLRPEDRRNKAFPLHPEEPFEEAKALTFSLLISIANFTTMKQLLLITLTVLMSPMTIHAQEDP